MGLESNRAGRLGVGGPPFPHVVLPRLSRAGRSTTKPLLPDAAFTQMRGER